MDTALEVVRLILEYFGWERDALIENLLLRGETMRVRRRNIVRQIARFLSNYRFSLFTKRSLIREIGSRLPLKPCERPYFELNIPRNEQEYDGKPLSQMFMASLADVGWITEDDDLSSEMVIDEEEYYEITSPEKEAQQLPLPDESGDVKKENIPEEAMQKISALEDELQKLRAQIAMMVVAVPTNQVSTPSTPMGAGAPPAPPPPPPPPPTPMSTPLKPVSQIIKENRARRLSLAPESLIGPEQSTGPSLPNMADVLKGLGKVKLRSVERSPGGTPVRKPPITADATDPASIIAQALKKKFAHRRRHDTSSPEINKENSSPFGSPFGTPPSSPVKPAPFGPHLLKPTNRKRRLSTGLQRTASKPRSPLVEVC